jgi:hypothetical protein
VLTSEPFLDGQGAGTNSRQVQNSARPTFRSIAITFVLAAVFYFIAYSWLSKRQTARGPWQVTFTNDAAGVPELIIAQRSIGVSNVYVRFDGESLNATQHTGVVEFAKPKAEVPFGRVIYDDLMFMPGTVTLDCFGHEVEMLPRTLSLNRKPVRWASNSTNSLTAAMKLPPEERRKVKGGYRK